MRLYIWLGPSLESGVLLRSLTVSAAKCLSSRLDYNIKTKDSCSRTDSGWLGAVVAVCKKKTSTSNIDRRTKNNH